LITNDKGNFEMAVTLIEYQPKVLQYFAELKETVSILDSMPIAEAIAALQEARLQERRIFVMGNGGSATTASHFVCDLAKNTRHPDVAPFKIIGLSDNMGLMTAYANDEGYENVFAQQMANLLQANDVVVAISTSGNSANVVKAVKMANEAGALTIGLTGFNAGKLGNMVNLHLHVPSDCIEQVEDIHLILTHLIVKTLKEKVSEGK
jgi:D-sedoheptulose 7-phosphate isomerase